MNHYRTRRISIKNQKQSFCKKNRTYLNNLELLKKSEQSWKKKLSKQWKFFLYKKEIVYKEVICKGQYIKISLYYLFYDYLCNDYVWFYFCLTECMNIWQQKWHILLILFDT